MKGANLIGGAFAAVLFILAWPFIWLYEQVGGTIFILIVVGAPLSIWAYRSLRHGQTTAPPATPARPAPPQETEMERKARKKTVADAFQAENRRIIRKREEAAHRHAVHTVVDDQGEVHVHWRRQLQEIKDAWQAGDYDYARTWLQKLAYRLTSEHAPEEIHAQFKNLMVAFTRDDPLYADVMRVALPVIAASPGIVQSVLAKQFPQFDAEQFRYAMYYGAEIGEVIREKKGRSYALRLPG